MSELRIRRNGKGQITTVRNVSKEERENEGCGFIFLILFLLFAFGAC